MLAAAAGESSWPEPGEPEKSGGQEEGSGLQPLQVTHIRRRWGQLGAAGIMVVRGTTTPRRGHRAQERVLPLYSAVMYCTVQEWAGHQGVTPPT